jgi:hypothetical protein
MQFSFLFSISKVNYTPAFRYVPVFGSFKMPLHAKTLAWHDCEFFDFGACYLV